MRCGPGRLREVRTKFDGWRGRGAEALRGAAVLALAGAVPATAGAQQQTSAPTSLIFDGVTVVDVEQGKLVPDQRVVIAGNRIQTVGNTGAVQLPQGAQVVDARGKYLIPGLWDMHVHSHTNIDSELLGDYPTTYYSLLIANGVTGIREASSDAPLENHMKWWQEVLAGTHVGPPRQLLAGPILSTQDSAERWHWVDSLKAAGANFIKTYPFNFALAAAARRAGVRFGGHVGGAHEGPLGKISATEASDSGITIIDHINTSGGIDTLCYKPRGGSLERCQPLVERLIRNGTWFVPTLLVLAEVGASEEQGGLGERSRPIFDRFAARVEEFWGGSSPVGNWLRDSLGKGLPSPSPTDSAGNLSVMQRARLPILIGSDVSWNKLQTLPPGFALHAELAMCVAEGLSPLNALQAATLNPAKMLHATDSLGTVALGKLADLVLLDADPLADITNTTTVRAVVANGRYFDRAVLDSLLSEARAKAKDAGKEP